MNTQLSTEIISLIIMTVFFLLAWVPSSIAKYQTFGPKWLASNRRPLEKSLEGWGHRAERAHENLKDYFPGFIVAIVLIEYTSSETTLTSALAITYVCARVLHFISYTAGNVPLRALFWFISIIANLALFTQLF